jgi:hypothetical protein
MAIHTELTPSEAADRLTIREVVDAYVAAVRSLQPAASAARASVHPCSSTRAQINRRLLGQVRWLPCSFIRILLGAEWLRHPPASKEARMNNVLRNYT